MRRSAGFTLMELMLVVVLVSLLAGVMLSRNSDVLESSQNDLTAVQLSELAKALRQFRTDVGYWPGEGGLVELAPTHPADLGVLLTKPSSCTGVCIWDSTAQRGWHGPYLQSLSMGWLRVGGLTVQGVSAGKVYPAEFGSTYQWYSAKATADAATASGLVSRGRPVLYYPPDASCPARPSNKCPARLMAAGADGDFGVSPSVVDVDCRPSPDTGAYKDNLVLCL